MNQELLLEEVRNYLASHIHTHPATFALQKHPFDNITSQELTQQLVGMQKAITKFPSLYKNPNVLYPPKVNLEQTSSELTANYKAKLALGETFIDLTGGFGLDVYAFAKAGLRTTHIEQNNSLAVYSRQLFKAFSLTVETRTGDGIALLTREGRPYDTIYLDPGRKTHKTQKAIQLEDYEPNVLDYLEVLLQRCRRLLIKTSPMLDITAGLSALKYVRELHVVAVKNEVKEMVWVIQNSKHPIQGHTQISCVNILSEQENFSFVEGENNDSIEFSEPLKYLYEPNAAIMKAQAFGELASRYGMKKLATSSHLFTSQLRHRFPGRVFQIIKVQRYKPKLIKRNYGNGRYGVVARNFKIPVAAIREKFNLGENRQQYLFFTTDHAQQQIVIEVTKL
ncbi:MAG: methyltransferase [Nonlabens sp.]